MTSKVQKWGLSPLWMRMNISTAYLKSAQIWKKSWSTYAIWSTLTCIWAQRDALESCNRYPMINYFEYSTLVFIVICDDKKLQNTLGKIDLTPKHAIVVGCDKRYHRISWSWSLKVSRKAMVFVCTCNVLLWFMVTLTHYTP